MADETFSMEGASAWPTAAEMVSKTLEHYGFSMLQVDRRAREVGLSHVTNTALSRIIGGHRHSEEPLHGLTVTSLASILEPEGTDTWRSLVMMLMSANNPPLQRHMWTIYPAASDLLREITGYDDDKERGASLRARHRDLLARKKDLLEAERRVDLEEQAVRAMLAKAPVKATGKAPK